MADPHKADVVSRATARLRELIRASQYDQAIALAEKLVSHYPNDASGWWWYAIAYSQSDLRKTACALERVLTLRPDMTPAREKLALVNARLAARTSAPPARSTRQAEVQPVSAGTADTQPAMSPVTASATDTQETPAAADTQKILAVPAQPLSTNHDLSDDTVSFTPAPLVVPPVALATLLAEPTAPATALTAAVPNTAGDKEKRKNAPEPKSSHSVPLVGSLASLAISIPAGIYLVATIGVIEVIIGTIIFGLEGLFALLSDFNLLSLIIIVLGLLLLLLIGVIAGLIAAVGGAIVGAVGGAVVGVANLLIAVVLGLVYRPLALLLMPIAGTVISVHLYNVVVYPEIVDFATDFSCKFLADLNYILVGVVGFVLGVLPAVFETSPEESSEQVSAEAATSVRAADSVADSAADDEDLAAMGQALLAPWKLFGRLAVGATRTSFAGLSVYADVGSDLLEDETTHSIRSRNRAEIQRVARKKGVKLNYSEARKLEHQLNRSGSTHVVEKKGW